MSEEGKSLQGKLNAQRIYVKETAKHLHATLAQYFLAESDEEELLAVMERLEKAIKARRETEHAVVEERGLG